MPTKERKPKFIDLFAGCGGLSLGLELVGFEPVFVNELNTDAMETYLRNRDKHFPWLRKYHVADVKDMVLNPSYLADLSDGLRDDFKIQEGELDLLVGGPPCQGFSGIGHRRSYSVERKQIPSNYLFEDMAYVIHRLKPRIFLFENVGGLLSAKWTSNGVKGEIWEQIQETFKSVLPAYQMNSALVFAKHYGVPQNRPRVLLVGIRTEGRGRIDRLPPESSVAKGFLPASTNNYPSIPEILGDLLDPDYKNGGRTERYPDRASNRIQRFLRTDFGSTRVRPKGSPVSEHEYSNHSPAIVQKFQYMVDNDGKIPESMRTKKFAQRVLPPVWGPEGPSITATSLPDDYVHYKQPRTLTVREWARLQTFPDWYEFAGKRTTGGIRRAGNPRQGVFTREVPKYTQIGNAVPVLLARAIGNHFRTILGLEPVPVPQ